MPQYKQNKVIGQHCLLNKGIPFAIHTHGKNAGKNHHSLNVVDKSILQYKYNITVLLNMMKQPNIVNGSFISLSPSTKDLKETYKRIFEF